MSDRKKNHHFVPDAYLNKWRKNDTLFALTIESLKPFNPGRSGAGAKNKFYSFDFDPKVIGLLNYTFGEMAEKGEPGNIYQMMLCFIGVMKDFEYPNKESNLFEDFLKKSKMA